MAALQDAVEAFTHQRNVTERTAHPRFLGQPAAPAGIVAQRAQQALDLHLDIGDLIGCQCRRKSWRPYVVGFVCGVICAIACNVVLQYYNGQYSYGGRWGTAATPATDDLTAGTAVDFVRPMPEETDTAGGHKVDDSFFQKAIGWIWCIFDQILDAIVEKVYGP